MPEDSSLNFSEGVEVRVALNRFFKLKSHEEKVRHQSLRPSLGLRVCNLHGLRLVLEELVVEQVLNPLTHLERSPELVAFDEVEEGRHTREQNVLVGHHQKVSVGVVRHSVAVEGWKHAEKLDLLVFEDTELC